MQFLLSLSMFIGYCTLSSIALDTYKNIDAIPLKRVNQSPALERENILSDKKKIEEMQIAFCGGWMCETFEES